MNELTDFLTTKEMIVVYIVVASITFISIIIYMLKKNSIKTKLKNNTKELNTLIDNNIESPVKVSKTEVKVIPPMPSPVTIGLPKEEKIEEIKPIVEEKKEVIEVAPVTIEEVVEELSVEPIIENNEIIYVENEPNKTEAQAALKELTEQLQKAEEITKTIELTSFEEEQEKNAIISFEELMQKTKPLYDQNQLMSYEDEGNETISLNELELQMRSLAAPVEEVVTNQLVIEPIIEKIPEEIKEDNPIIENTIIKEEKSLFNTNFKLSPVISPIHGIEKKEVVGVNSLQLENTANYEKLDEEIKKTNEFLITLKELQKNLE